MGQVSNTQSQPLISMQLSSPVWIPVSVKDLMATGYARRVQTSFQPTIIDPLRIPEYVRDGHLIYGFYDSNDVRHWFISTNPDAPYPNLCDLKATDEFEIPCCFKRPQRYSVEVPWELIGQKKAMLNDDGWVVFVDPEFEGQTLVTDQYRIINDLFAFII